MIDRYAVRGLREEAHPALTSAEASRRPASASGDRTHLRRVVWSLTSRGASLVRGRSREYSLASTIGTKIGEVDGDLSGTVYFAGHGDPLLMTPSRLARTAACCPRSRIEKPALAPEISDLPKDGCPAVWLVKLALRLRRSWPNEALSYGRC
jgi:hypothetical protein